MSPSRALACLLCGCLLWLAGPAVALDPQRSVTQFHHTAWTVNEGAPGQVTALAQTPDGYLWLGTEIGLYRFDGDRFTRFIPPDASTFPASSVSTLYTSRSGGLWVGFRYGGISLIESGHLRHFSVQQGLPTSTVYRMAEDAEGRLWAATFTGPFYFDGQRWNRPAASMAYPGQQARTVFTDREGTLWIATGDGMVVLQRGSSAFVAVPGKVGRVSQIAQAPDGAIWVAEADGGIRPLSGTGEDAPSAGLLFDRDGVLWASTLGAGLLRFGPGDAMPRPERFQRSDGLSSDYLQPLLEDREGNLWVGSSRGLDRFRHANLAEVPMPEGSQDFAIAADGDRLLVGTRNQPLQRVTATTREPLALSTTITAIQRDASGGLWLAGPDGVWKAEGTQFHRITDLPVPTRSGVQAMAITRDGALWLSLNTPGLHRYQQGRWTQVQDRAGLPAGDSPLVMHVDTRNRLWLGFARGVVAVMEGDRFHTPWSEEAPRVGNVTALHEDGNAMWIGGERGLARIEAGRVRNVVPAVLEDFRGISGIVSDAAGDLWLNGARGVLHVRAADLPALFGGPERPRYETFNALDGLPGIAAQFRPLPTAARSDDGRLWFATTSGLVSMDPRRIARNLIPPPVEILSLEADGTDLPFDQGETKLAAGTRNLRIGFTALSLSIPERVRFRYQLEGFDSRWIETSERSALYNAPGHGRYVFRVMASNNDGVWNETGDSLVISIAPNYWETGWFRALCVIVLAGVLWLLYLLRLRQVGARIRARLDERHRERERIARELHDTLLQSTQGLILRLDASSRKLAGDDPVRTELESAINTAERVAAEGRERVRGLRRHSGESRDLGAALLGVQEETGQDVPVVRLVVEGAPRPIQQRVWEEAYMIGREALLNAFQHADATSVEIRIRYSRHAFALRIRDDGVGFQPDGLAGNGHWGLAGMRERAARVGGTLRVRSGPSRQGTEVLLQVRGSLAWEKAGFKGGTRRHLRRLMKRFW